MHKHTIKELAKLLKSKKISSVELSKYYLGRITNHKSLNAVLHIDEEQTMRQACKADKRLSKSLSNINQDNYNNFAEILCGIPLLHKDIFVTKNWISSAGSKMLSNYISPYDATVVAKLKQAGMVCLGKTNTDEFAMGSSTEHSYFGVTRNPWNLNLIPGGSSGGAASAIAARLAPAATATDTGGSIRQPAALCGITGIKPSYGRISRFGMIAFASSLDQAGPMAINAEDCAILLGCMAGPDHQDSTCANIPNEDYTRFLGKTWLQSNGNDKQLIAKDKPIDNKSLVGLRIGLPKEYFAEGLDENVRKVINCAISEFENLGATLVEISLTKTELALPVYYLIAPAEAASNLARFDGVRYGYRTAVYDNLEQMYAKTRAEGFGHEVKRRILIGTYALSHGYYDAYYLQAQKIRRMIADDFENAFTKCDVIMGPVTPTTAWPIGEKISDPLKMYLADIYTMASSLAGLPAMSVPCGKCYDLPVGLQIIGRHFMESKLLQIGHAFQQITDWHLCFPRVISS